MAFYVKHTRTMMIGDLHLKGRRLLPAIQEAVEDFAIERVVLLGDYLDGDWNATPDDYIAECEALTDWAVQQRAAGITVDFLMGNHDLTFFGADPWESRSPEFVAHVRPLLEALPVVVATTVDGWLVTHAGVTAPWAEHYLPDALDPSATADDIADALNRLQEQTSWDALGTVGPRRGGHREPGPVWADRTELQRSAIPRIPQVVAHTHVGTCTLAISDKNTPLWFCDTLWGMDPAWPLSDGSVLISDGRWSSRPLVEHPADEAEPLNPAACPPRQSGDYLRGRDDAFHEMQRHLGPRLLRFNANRVLSDAQYWLRETGIDTHRRRLQAQDERWDRQRAFLEERLGSEGLGPVNLNALARSFGAEFGLGLEAARRVTAKQLNFIARQEGGVPLLRLPDGAFELISQDSLQMEDCHDE